MSQKGLRFGSIFKVIKGPVVGIDLGTTYSAIAIHKNGETIVIPNEMGNRITPSMVSFTDKERLIGDGAKNIMASNPLNTIYGAKRLIGRMFSDKSVQKDSKLFPFKIIKDNKTGKPLVEIKYKGSIKRYTAEEISSMILSKMKQIAEDYLGEKVTNAVITVPAYFNDNQRQATKDAGKIAGLNVLRLINEPTAAAMAYGMHDKISKNSEKNIIVYDLGGGTFDVTLMTLDDENVFEVLSTNGDTHLGGEDFDNRIISYYIKTINKKYNIDIKNNEKSLSKLKREVEKAKRSLSTAKQIRIEIDNIANSGIDFSDTLTRAKFENLNNDLFKKTLKPLEKVLSDSGLSKSDINEIVLVGGSTRIPKIQEIVSKFFNGKSINRGINADEAVAYGAALQGAILSNNIDTNMVVLDVTPLSLGIETVGGIMTKIIDKDTVIPTSKKQVFSTYVDNQPAVTIKIFQGERSMTKDNMKLGEFELSGIPPAPKGQPQIEVTFNVNVNGLLTVTAKDKSNGNSADLTIDKETSNLSDEEIKKALEEAKEFEDEDKLQKNIVETKNKLESKAYYIKNKIDDLNISDEYDKDTLVEACDDILSWLDSNSYDAELDDLKEKFQEFDDLVDPIMSKYNGYSKDYSDNNNNNNNDYDHEEL